MGWSKLSVPQHIEVLLFTLPTEVNSNSPFIYPASQQHCLCMAKEFKYLGVTFSSDTSWNPRINAVCLRKRKLVGMLFRKFYCHTDSHSLLKLYLLTVHPHMEYPCSVWDPYLKKNIDAIEHVQKFALKVCQKDWHSDYDTLLNSANVPPLAARRKALKLRQLFSIIQGHSESISWPSYFQTASPYLNCIRSTNSATLTPPFAHFKILFSLLRWNYGTHYL